MKNEVGTTGLIMEEPLIFEQGSEGRCGFTFPMEMEKQESDVSSIPESMLREEIEGFPQISEVEVVRHFTRLSQWNYGVDTGFYPLGSCTMKYNPKVNEDIAKFEGFTHLHPFQPESHLQGAMELLYNLEKFLCEITGMDRATLQPAAGAHGELTGMMIIRAYFKNKGEQRDKVIVPDTAHGTNPASVSMCGFKVLPVKSNMDGMVDPDSVKSLMDERVAAIMLTNPNTLGIFESRIGDIADIVHQKGALLYCDGANLNALMGISRFGDIGCDLVHLNLHKTFSTPHGGGGPGSGPLAVKNFLFPFLPVPVIEKKDKMYIFKYDLPYSIGKVRSFYGNFLVCVKAYSYIMSMGEEGLRNASVSAVAGANYLKKKLIPYFHLPYKTPSLHECVFTDQNQQSRGVSTLDIAKRLVDLGFHPPTIYFPLVVQGALMIEPTESESRESLDQFIQAMIRIAKEAEENPSILKKAPQKTKVGRVDDVRAARNPVLRWTGT